MNGLLIADENFESRKQMADLLIDAGYQVTVTTSVASALYGILKKTAQVVVLGGQFDELTALDLIPLLKKCNRNLSIILVSDNLPVAILRKLRKEGIFYHALKPVLPEDREEIRQVVQCAFRSLANSVG